MSKQPTTPPPAYFLSLSLENVRSFGEEQTISFAREDGCPAQWTIILGDNGVGKTTVLKSLAALRPVKGRLDTDTLEPAYIQKWRNAWLIARNGRQATSKHEMIVPITPSYVHGRPSNMVQPRTVQDIPDFSVSSLECTIETGAKISDRNSRKVSNKVLYDIKSPFSRGKSLGTGWTMIAAEARDAICYGYGAGRTVGNSTLGSTQETEDDTCVALFDDRADLINPEEWFLQLDYNSLKEQKDRSKMTLEQVRQALLLVLPDVTDIQIKSTEKHQQQLELLTPYGWVRLRDMSLGYQTLVVWLTDFASKLFIRYPNSKNPLEEPAIVLIDEIDLHLHPSWQRKLIGFLSGIFKNTQFIATAHSPLVVQAAGDAGANVVLLKREGDQTIVHQDLADVRGWRIDQILNSELFEETSSLSEQTEADLQLRNKLLLKKRLTAKDKATLEELNAKVANQPIGDTQPERRVENLLARLARNLKDDDLLK